MIYTICAGLSKEDNNLCHQYPIKKSNEYIMITAVCARLSEAKYVVIMPSVPD